MNTIKLKDYLHVQEEYMATAVAITPGMLLELDNAGKVQAHSGGAQPVLPMFATEDDLQGKGIDDNYLASNQIQVWVPQRGDEVYALLAVGENVAIGDKLESNGAGALEKWVADLASSAGAPIYPNVLVGVALEALDLSGGGSVLTHIKVKII